VFEQAGYTNFRQRPIPRLTWSWKPAPDQQGEPAAEVRIVYVIHFSAPIRCRRPFLWASVGDTDPGMDTLGKNRSMLFAHTRPATISTGVAWAW
jgi:hypothetical protein